MATSLVVIQPTSFCNLDCRYCYLPDRAVRGNMGEETLDRFFAVLFNSKLASQCRIVWHAGEPLVSGVAFYRNALEIQRQYQRGSAQIKHWIQTNGVLLSDEWGEFLSANNIGISISIDGPKWMHDASRRDRNGASTFARVEQGIATLKKWNINFQALSVVSRRSLSHPDEYFDYMLETGIERVGLNIEELNMQARMSSMVEDDAAEFMALEQEYRAFMGRLFELWKQHHRRIEIRELSQMYYVVNEKAKNPNFRRTSEEHVGLDILNIKKNGDVSTFAPELVESRDGDRDAFVLANVRDIASFDQLALEPSYKAIASKVRSGINRCRDECAYFDFCGGGHLSAKYFENGTLDSTQTKYCRLHRQALVDTVIDGLGAC